MLTDGDARQIVSALRDGAKAINRLAKAQEHANEIAIDIERTRREEVRPDDYGRPDKPPQGILGG